MSRLCGAWVLDTDALQSRLPALLATRVRLTTTGGRTVLDARGHAGNLEVDPTATLAAVVAVRDEMQAEYERRRATATKGKQVLPPRWPALPGPLDIEGALAASPGADARTLRALGIARWFGQLCRAWENLEGQRLTRTYLRPMGGDTVRRLPTVLNRRDLNPPA